VFAGPQQILKQALHTGGFVNWGVCLVARMLRLNPPPPHFTVVGLLGHLRPWLMVFAVLFWSACFVIGQDAHRK